MAYIINVNKEMSVTVNLSQGLIQLNPQQHREISAQDLDYALQNYNSEKLGLIVVRTDKELELILNGFKTKIELSENSEGSVYENYIPVTENEAEKESEDSDEKKLDEIEENVKEDSSEDAEDSEKESDEIKEESEQNKSNEDENVKEETSGEVTPEQKAKAKKLLIEEINAASKDGDISRLKELASDLEVKLSPNAGILNIANKLKVHVANL